MVDKVRRLSLTSLLHRKLDDIDERWTGPPPDGGIASKAVRRLLWRALIIGLVAVVCVVLSVVLYQAPSAHAESLLRDGTHTEGTVFVHVPRKGPKPRDAVYDVEYSAGGRELTRSYRGPDDKLIEDGARVDIVYDPDDPTDFQITGMPHETPVLGLFLIVLLLLTFCGFGFGALVGIPRWARRVGRAGPGDWRPGESTTVPGHRRVVVITFDDGNRTTLSLTRPVCRSIPSFHLGGPVLVAGTGTRITVLFVRGPVLAAARERPWR
ncbi:DUF3592 domain-containing protein [Actinokineospora terrae]|uniref:DUF3592 domain-containing protein n=1 Tax=Actinokineospora terrae TaxID=155974 RepID=A0A1H9MJ35_9PSEU|nr:DUF3592 domain-containing protein [Actinokineospora terrae]SER23704.1 hypothetical protein SAMN04487818_102187 [Actinokineospora terrae]